jgi:hypothetical protein
MNLFRPFLKEKLVNKVTVPACSFLVSNLGTDNLKFSQTKHEAGNIFLCKAETSHWPPPSADLVLTVILLQIGRVRKRTHGVTFVARSL